MMMQRHLLNLQKMLVCQPHEDNVGYEVEGDDGEVVATVEIAWPDRRVGFMTAQQAEDKEKLEN